MNPFKKRVKSPAIEKRRRNGGPAGRANITKGPQILTASDIAFYLPSESDFRTSLLLPKMADRFSLLRLEDQIQSNEYPSPFVNHSRDLSVLEEGDEEDENLPVRPWGGSGRRERPNEIDPNMSKDEFIKVRAQDGNMLFSGKQRTFKFRSEEENDINRQYSSSSISSKSPHSPAFEYRPSSSRTSATSSIVLSTAKPPLTTSRPHINLGFDFGLAETQTSQVPSSPTSTVYEVIDSPTLPDYLVAEDEPTAVDLVRDHLRRPSTAHTQHSIPLNYHEEHYPGHAREDSKDSWTRPETVFRLDDVDNDYTFYDDNSGVFDSYYQERLSHEGVDEEERIIMGEEWIQTRHTGRSSPNRSQNGTYLTPPKNTARKAKERISLFDDLAPAKPRLDVKTNVTVIATTTFAEPKPSLATERMSSGSMATSPTISRSPRSLEPWSGEIVVFSDGGKSSRSDSSQEINSRSRQGSTTEPSQRSRSNSVARNTVTSHLNDLRYFTPEMPPASVFPNTPPQSGFISQNSSSNQVPIPQHPDQTLTPPPTNTERKAPTANVKKALKERMISEPQLISMTANVPTQPIIRMADDKLAQIRNERRKTTRMGVKSNTIRKATGPRRAMLEDEPDEVRTQSPASSPTSPFTRRNGSSPGMATRPQPRRRETTAGSVLFDESLRDPSVSPRLLAGPEYTITPPHKMNDNPYQGVSQQKPRHRRKVSRQDVDPITTYSSPAILKQWDGHPRQQVEYTVEHEW